MSNQIANIDGILITPQKVIDVTGGNILHCMKSKEIGFNGFGEAYFSMVNPNAVKAWKRHREMTLNLIVPIGAIRFVIYDDREWSYSFGKFQEIILSRVNYFRLTLPPMLWFGFQGIDLETSLLLNIANVNHSEEEIDRKDLNEINFFWEKKN